MPALACSTLALLPFLFAAVPPQQASPSAAIPDMLVESGTVEVPADHQAKGKETITLPFERFRTKGSSAKPLIMLHGGPGDSVPVKRILVGTDLGKVLVGPYDVVYFDQRDTPRVLGDKAKDAEWAKTHSQRYTMAQHIEDIELLRKKLFGPKAKITILGSSWGGFLGLGYALRYPQNVEQLMLGSFAATSWWTTDWCRNLDERIVAAQVENPALSRSLRAFQEAVQAKKIIWHKGKKEERAVVLADGLEVVSPFMGKAKYDQLVKVLDAIVAGQADGLEYLESLELASIKFSAGGSPAAQATYCQELMSMDAAKAQVENPYATTWCDSRVFAQANIQACQAMGGRAKPRDDRAALGTLNVPVLAFAGRWDPIIPWQQTAQAVQLMPRASFVLIDGGHTPVSEGGACLANAIAAFSRGEQPGYLDCGRAHQQP